LEAGSRGEGVHGVEEVGSLMNKPWMWSHRNKLGGLMDGGQRFSWTVGKREGMRNLEGQTPGFELYSEGRGKP
jgi:hypothetical protein